MHDLTRLVSGLCFCEISYVKTRNKKKASLNQLNVFGRINVSTMVKSYVVFIF